MSALYLVKFKPMEAYTFASETSYGGAFESKSNNQPTYVLKSKEIPEQSTIFGSVRYLLLQATGVLRSDYNYDNKDELNKVIGSSSFSFENTEQTFGMIKKVGPVFICDRENKIVVQNPKCNKTKDGFVPFEMEKVACSSQGNNTHLPKKHAFSEKKEYDAKESWKLNGFVRLTDKGITKVELEKDETLFSYTMMTGNAINKETDGFFKYEVISMAEGYSFATVVELEDNVKGMLQKTEGMVVYMGKKRSAFLATMEPVTSEVYEEALAKMAIGYKKGETDLNWYYAASDVVLPEGYIYPDFSAVDSKSIRNLTTNYSAKDQKARLSRSDKQYNLIKAGSVFYGFNPNEAFATADANMLLHLQLIGLNKIVRIGE